MLHLVSKQKKIKNKSTLFSNRIIDQKNMSNIKKSVVVVLLILILDQTVKLWIKTHMFIGQEYPILGNWFIIHFTENEGMAFGWKFGGEFGKIFLSIFRIIAVFVIAWYTYMLSKKNAPAGLIISISMILAGAIGNIIDSAVYGLIFNESNYQVAQFLPPNGGYASFLHGKVVDMLYFPIINTTIPEWFPIWKNELFIFFRPVFNIADSSITIGVFAIIIFYRRFLHKEISEENKTVTETISETIQGTAESQIENTSTL
jgi:signal peptidase II